MVYYSVPVVCALPAEYCVLLLGGSTIFYGVLLAMQVLFYGLGYWGYYLSTKQIKNKLLFIPYYFLFMNVQCAERHPISEEEKRKRSLGKGEAC